MINDIASLIICSKVPLFRYFLITSQIYQMIQNVMFEFVAYNIALLIIERFLLTTKTKFGNELVSSLYFLSNPFKFYCNRTSVSSIIISTL